MTVYLDRVFLLNSLVDYLLLLCTALFCGRKLHRMRFLLCGTFGGVYATAVFFFTALSHPLIKCVAGLLIAFLAYVGEQHWYRLAATFFLLSAGLAGTLMALGFMVGEPDAILSRVYCAQISWPVLFGTFSLFFILLHLFLGRTGQHERGEMMKITIMMEGKPQSIQALYDTGNTLRDPIRGENVLVVEQNALQWPECEKRILNCALTAEEKMARLYEANTQFHFALLPYKAIGTASGLLLAVRSDAIIVEGETYSKVYIALWNGEIGDSAGYQALWSGRKGEKHCVEKNKKLYLPTVEKAG